MFGDSDETEEDLFGEKNSSTKKSTAADDEDDDIFGANAVRSFHRLVLL